MRVSPFHQSDPMFRDRSLTLLFSRIVEYATREQAQQAVATLSNQNLMGRLIYVREVRHLGSLMCSTWDWLG